MVRLGLSLELGVTEPVLRNIAQTAGTEDLMALKEGLQQRLDEMLPITTQLMGFRKEPDAVESGFLI